MIFDTSDSSSDLAALADDAAAPVLSRSGTPSSSSSHPGRGRGAPTQVRQEGRGGQGCRSGRDAPSGLARRAEGAGGRGARHRCCRRRRGRSPFRRSAASPLLAYRRGRRQGPHDVHGGWPVACRGGARVPLVVVGGGRGRSGSGGATLFFLFFFVCEPAKALSSSSFFLSFFLSPPNSLAPPPKR